MEGVDVDSDVRFGWGRTIEVLDDVASVDDPAEFGFHVLKALGAVVDCDIGSYNEYDPVAQRAVYHVHPGEDRPVSPDADREGFARLILQNPILRFHRDTGDASARRISDFISSTQLHQLELYQRVYKYLGVEFQVAFALVLREPLVVGVALSRSERDFLDEEVAFLNALRPYLVEVYRDLRDLEVLARSSSSDGRGVMRLDPQGHLLDATGPSLGLLTQYFGPARRPSGLPDAVSQWGLTQRVRRLDDGRPRLRFPLVSVIDERELTARFIAGTTRRADTVVLEERVVVRGAADLVALGLTEREAQILFLLIRGASTFAITQELRVTTGTVNKHLQHVYRKLGVSNRTAAVAAGSDALYSRS